MTRTTKGKRARTGSQPHPIQPDGSPLPEISAGSFSRSWGLLSDDPRLHGDAAQRLIEGEVLAAGPNAVPPHGEAAAPPLGGRRLRRARISEGQVSTRVGRRPVDRSAIAL